MTNEAPQPVGTHNTSPLGMIVGIVAVLAIGTCLLMAVAPKTKASPSTPPAPVIGTTMTTCYTLGTWWKAELTSNGLELKKLKAGWQTVAIGKSGISGCRILAMAGGHGGNPSIILDKTGFGFQIVMELKNGKLIPVGGPINNTDPTIPEAPEGPMD